MRNFHDSGEISPLLVFWSVSSPPGELKNLNIPIGITRFSACGGQGTTRILQKMILASFYRFSRNFAENGENLVNLGEIMDFYFCRFFGVEVAQTLILSKEYKGFVKGCGIQKIHEFHEIL